MEVIVPDAGQAQTGFPGPLEIADGVKVVSLEAVEQERACCRQAAEVGKQVRRDGLPNAGIILGGAVPDPDGVVEQVEVFPPHVDELGLPAGYGERKPGDGEKVRRMLFHHV